jgi:hypothetical protein
MEETRAAAAAAAAGPTSAREAGRLARRSGREARRWVWGRWCRRRRWRRRSRRKKGAVAVVAGAALRRAAAAGRRGRGGEETGRRSISVKLVVEWEEGGATARQAVVERDWEKGKWDVDGKEKERAELFGPFERKAHRQFVAISPGGAHGFSR